MRARRRPRVKLRARRRAVAAALGALGIVLASAGSRDPGPGAALQPVATAAWAAGSKQPAPSGRSQTQITEGKPAQAWFENPIGRIAYVYRMARYLGDKPNQNIAIGFVDITGLNNLDTRGYRVMDVSDLKRSSPALYDELRLAERPHIRRIAIVPASNAPQAPGTNGSQHSEQVIIFKHLTYLSPSDGGASITLDRLFALYSDRSPCGPKKNNCASLMSSGTDIYYATVDGASAVDELETFISVAQAQAFGSSTIKQEIADEKELIQQRKDAKPSRKQALAKSGKSVDDAIERRDLFRASRAKTSNAESPTNSSPAPASTGDNGFAQALAEPLVAASGGIDFSHLQLGYLADPGDGSGLQYAFQSPSAAAGGGTPTGALDTAALSSDAFFVWLELDRSTFWVNLNPGEPDRVVDPQMGLTDVGRIMLQADLQLKKDVGTLIHPGTSLGDQFWSGIDGNCLSSRVWVVPAPAQIYSTADKLYILSAPLTVKMESDYVQLPPGQSSAASCPRQDEATQAHNETLFRGLILPRLINLVNTDPSFADLRTIYRSRVAAEWYRNLSASQHTTYADLVDHSDIAPWTTKIGWKPTDTFQQYVTSYVKGDYHLTRTVTRGNYIYTYTYTYGGVDLTDVPLDQVSATTFAANDAGLAQDVSQSLAMPTVSGSGTIWLGSPTPLQAARASAPPAPASTSPLASAMLRWLLLLLPPIALIALRRRRRTRTSR